MKEFGGCLIVRIRLGISLAIRDLINRYKWSKIGALWPLLSFAIYVLVVSIVYKEVFNLEIKGYLPYLATGIASWLFVQTFLVEGVNLYITFKGLIVNVNLPFWIYHFSLSIKAIILLFLQLPVIFIIKLFFNDDFFPGLLILPISLALVSIIGIMISRIFSILGSLFRDFAHLVPSITTILTLITPILYPIELLDKAKWLYIYNPMYYLVSLVREPLSGLIPQEKHFLVCIFIALILFIFAEILEKVLVKKVITLI